MSSNPTTTLRDTISASLIERDSEVYAILLALVAREHCLFVGPPGVAKSLICRNVSKAIDGMKFCERLLAPTTAKEELFGPVSISALRMDRYEHMGTDTASDCHLFFADEVFRASDAIADTLLHLLGPERQALIGTQQVKVPMVSAIGATNSWPEGTHQNAMLDRWLIRRTVRPVSPAGKERLIFDTLPDVTPVCTLADIEAAHAAAMALPVHADTKAKMMEILDELAANGIKPSDRRCRKSFVIARAAAYLDGASAVMPQHLEALADVLWDDPNEQPEKCAEIVTRIANPVGAKLNELLREVDAVVSEAVDAATRMAAIKKLEKSEKEADKLRVGGNGRATKCFDYIRRERVRMQAAALGIDPSKAEALLGGK